MELLDFTLPPGVDRDMVRKAIPKLKTGIGNEFVEVRPGTGGANTLRILTSETDPMPTYVSFDPAAVAASKAMPFCTGVEGGPLEYDVKTSPHALILGGSGAGKSACLQTLITAALLKHWDLYVLDPTKGGADFRVFEDHSKAFAVDLYSAAAAIRGIYAEVVRRKNVNSAHGVGSYTDLPDELRPPHIVVVIDEFTSLMAAQEVDRTPSEDPEIEQERQTVLAMNAARREIGSYTGRIAREARSAGVTLWLATQKLDAGILEKLGSKDLKDNMSRLLLGKTSFGAKMSGLISPEEAADLGEVVPRGRGLFESPMQYGTPVQIWYSPASELRGFVDQVRQPVAPGDKLDLAAYDRRPKEIDGPAVVPISLDSIAPDDGEVIDLGTDEISLDELMSELGDIIDDDSTDTLEPVPDADTDAVHHDVEGDPAALVEPLEPDGDDDAPPRFWGAPETTDSEPPTFQDLPTDEVAAEPLPDVDEDDMATPNTPPPDAWSDLAAAWGTAHEDTDDPRETTPQAPQWGPIDWGHEVPAATTNPDPGPDLWSGASAAWGAVAAPVVSADPSQPQEDWESPALGSSQLDPTWDVESDDF